MSGFITKLILLYAMASKKELFNLFYGESKDKLYRLCLGFTGNTADADDLFQEVLIKIWQNLESFRKESKLSTWAYRVATNTAMLFLKRRTQLYDRQTTLDTTVQQTPVAPGPEAAVQKEEQISKLYQAIATLKEIDRIIISLLFEKCSYQEIASITGLSPTNVGARINRIKNSLSKKLV